MEIVNAVYGATGFFPAEEKYGLRSQITRCDVSMPTNIAEGSAKRCRKDYRHYARISLGSAFELETHLLILDNQGWFPADRVEKGLILTREEQKMLTSFI